MTLFIYNTLTKQKEEFKPLVSGQIKMYACGVTVYDFCHLGHARSYIVWDTVRRYLNSLGYRVQYVQNFTDIDDKILTRARQENSSMEEVANRNISHYFEDMRRLNILDADSYPRATNFINGIQRLIFELEQQEYTYATNEGIYFSVNKQSNYGKFSGKKLEDQKVNAGGRNLNPSKKINSSDFVLWKKAKEGEPFWNSPWGKGRPGWHIECSAMVREVLGDQIDIHVGGNDLIFPHHENEIAQSEAVTKKRLANYWMHNGMVTVHGTKMSKSLGNFITIRELLDKEAIDPMAVRLLVLQAHYRKPIDFNKNSLKSASNSWLSLKEGLLLFSNRTDVELDLDSLLIQQFQTAMNDDFNTSSALSILFDIAKDLKRQSNLALHSDYKIMPEVFAKWRILVYLSQILGLEASVCSETNISEEEIQLLIQNRQKAKDQKDYREADRIRTFLKEKGVQLVDKEKETSWYTSPQ